MLTRFISLIYWCILTSTQQEELVTSHYMWVCQKVHPPAQPRSLDCGLEMSTRHRLEGRPAILERPGHFGQNGANFSTSYSLLQCHFETEVHAFYYMYPQNCLMGVFTLSLYRKVASRHLWFFVPEEREYILSDAQPQALNPIAFQRRGWKKSQ